MDDKSKFSLFGDKRFIWSSIAVLIGFLALASEVAYQQDTTPGWVILFGALAYKSAKKRKLGLVKDTNLRKVLEAAAIVLIVLFTLVTDRSILVNDPFPHLVIPIWAVGAYISMLIKNTQKSVAP